MRKLLRTFPDKGSRPDLKSTRNEQNCLKTEVVNELKNIKAEIKSESIIKDNDGFKFLVELLKTLRDNKNTKLLMICRQIQRIEIKNGSGILIAEEGLLDEIYQNQEYFATIKEFFKRFGLGFGIDKKNEVKSVAELLKEWLGDKLIINE